MSRTTKQELTHLFTLFCKEMGVEIGTKPGQWSLEHNTVFGWGIVEYMENGGVYCPFGYASQTTKVMREALYYMIEALRYKKSRV